MSNDRNQDEKVSAAYQDLAMARAPEHLDHQVLRMAKANAERPQYSRWIAWSRPLAWAATVALCLAITLEVTQVTTPDDIARRTAAEEVAAPAAVLAPELQKDKREQMLEQDMDQQLNEKNSPARSAAKQTVSEPATAGRMRQSDDLAEAESLEEVVVTSAIDSEVKGDGEVKEANELRREDKPVSARYSTSHALAADMNVNECSDESRSKPESWLECIIDLEAAGDADAAIRQRENFVEVFPDFKLP